MSKAHEALREIFAKLEKAADKDQLVRVMFAYAITAEDGSGSIELNYGALCEEMEDEMVAKLRESMAKRRKNAREAEESS